VPGQIARVERRERAVIHQDHIRRRAGHERAHFLREERRRQARVVGGGNLGDHVPRSQARIAIGHLVQQISRFPLRPHSVAEAVVAQRQRDPLGEHGIERGSADGVVHVRARLMRYPGARILEDGALSSVNVHGMGDDSLWPQDAEGVQPLDDTLTRLAQAIFLVGLVLGHVNVEARIQPAGRLHTRPQRLIGQRQAGVQPEGRRDERAHPRGAQEAHILGDARPRFVRAVAVGDFVAQHRAQPALLHRISDHVQTAVNEVGAGMMINQRRRAVLDRVHQAD